MSRIVDEAAAAYQRWRHMNDGAPPPPVTVVLTSGDTYIFNGLAVAPSGAADAASISSAGMALPVVILRDADIARIQIGETLASRFGFGGEETPGD